MKQITEDYVPYEIAVLLKEKGFDEYCLFCYEQNVFSHTTNFTLERALYRDILIGIKNSEFEENAIHNVFTAPSQSLALKWLREVHKIDVEIYVYNKDFYGNLSYAANIRKNGSLMMTNSSFISNTYEQAVEAALKYTLENLT